MSTLSEYRSWLVVEAAQGFGAATLAAKLLADIGCTVARLEMAGERLSDGDGDDPEARVDELISRGKHSVGIGYAEKSAAPALETLLRHAEVLVADGDGLANLQRALNIEDLRERFPGLTVCSCTPFGLTGPLAGWTGGEEIVQAMSGIMSITGHPASGPTRIAGAPLTHAAAMFAVTSILAEVLGKRAHGGEHPNKAAKYGGGLLDVSVYDAALAFQSAALPAFWLSGTAPEPIGNRHSMAAPWNSFRCADGWAIICAGNHPTWVRLCETIGRPDLLTDPRYATQGERVAHVDAIEAEITAWTAERSVADVEALLNAGTIACGSVLPLAEVIEHPQFRVRGLMAPGSQGRQSGGVFNLDREPLDIAEAPWRAGQGTGAILRERCGARLADYERWLAAGAIFESGVEEHVQAA